MKKMWVFLIVFGLVGYLMMFSTGADAEAKNTELKFQSIYPPPHVVVKNAFEPWFELVEQKSNGGIKIVYFPPRAIIKENETFEGAEYGIVDIGTSMCGRNPGKFPLHSVSELPLLFPSATVASQAIMKSFQQLPELRKEFNGVKTLWQWSSGTAHILTTKKQVKTMEDLKGLKIIGYTQMMLDTIQALGASPIQISPMDAYLSLERGMADGIVMSFEGARSLKLHESCKFAAKSDLLTITFYAVLSSMTYDGLTAEKKKIFDDTTGLQMAKNCGKALDQGDTQAGLWLAEQGMNIYPVPDVEKNRWVEKVRPIYEKLISNLEANGHNSAKKVLSTLQALTADLVQ